MRPRVYPITITFSLLVFFMGLLPVQAGDITLTNNSGDGNSSWFIEGESTLIINGFDLNSRGITLPVTLDAISIGVEQFAGGTVDAVVYADSDGGSPSNATLLSRQSVQISGTGTVRVALPEPVTVNAPVVWVGFYLPTGFHFFGDNSGSSVLTYWGWTPGTTFDLSNLSSAQVFGPGDGSSPVNISMGGVARITAEVTQGEGTVAAPGTTNADGTVPVVPVSARDVPIGVQMVSQESVDTSVLTRYGYCGELLFYDTEDIRVTGEGRFELHCRADVGAFSPGTITNFDEVPEDVPSYNRRGVLYDIFGTGNFLSGSSSEELVVPVTHCIRPEQADLNSAVIGIAYGAPREWRLLPSVRYGELVCAEMTHQGFISYFVPRSGDEATLNANLYISGTPRLLDGEGNRSDKILCKFTYRLQYSVHNEGFEETPLTTMRVQDFHIRTGTTIFTREFDLPPIPPGETLTVNITNFRAPSAYVNESHRMVFTIDPYNTVSEANETDNDAAIDYLLDYSTQCK